MERAVANLQVYQSGDQWCLSNGTTHCFLPRTFAPWQNQVYWSRCDKKAYVTTGAESRWVSEFLDCPAYVPFVAPEASAAKAPGAPAAAKAAAEAAPTPAPAHGSAIPIADAEAGSPAPPGPSTTTGRPPVPSPGLPDPDHSVRSEPRSVMMTTEHSIVYPPSLPPLLCATSAPGKTAFLPECPENDFVILVHPDTSEEMVVSPSLHYADYAIWR